jgi:hypothetical protein
MQFVTLRIDISLATIAFESGVHIFITMSHLPSMHITRHLYRLTFLRLLRKLAMVRHVRFRRRCAGRFAQFDCAGVAFAARGTIVIQI